MKRIPLSARYVYKGRFPEPRGYALVDDNDFERLTAMCAWQLSGTPRHPRAVATIDGVSQHMSRIVMGLAPGDQGHVDHIDGNTLNNQQANLRVVTHAQNSQNRRNHAGGSSRFRGVRWHTVANKWAAAASLAGKRHYLGVFDDELEAALAAQAFRDEHMPFAQPDPALVAALELRRAA